ncbi:MAG: hypothetical protein GXO22_08520 [Aquificae bacterium]|nr:hypothetical protein [Aquificota bacterium]
MRFLFIAFSSLFITSFSSGKDNTYLYENYAYKDLSRKIIVKGKVWDEIVALEASTRYEFIIPISVFLNKEPFFLFRNKYLKNPNYKRCFLNGKAGSNLELKKVFVILNELVCVNSDGVPTLKKPIKGYLLDENTDLGVSGKVVKIELLKGKKLKAIKLNGNQKVISVFELE